MIPEIGILIGCYIITKMMYYIDKGKITILVQICAVITIVVAVVVIITLFHTGFHDYPTSIPPSFSNSANHAILLSRFNGFLNY